MSRGWAVELTASAHREYRELEDGPRRSASAVIVELAEEGPDLAGAIPLRGYPDTWRVRFHERFRMIYRVSRKQRRIVVVRVRERGAAYQGM